MSKVRVVNFEPTSKGENTHLYIIENNSGASVTLCRRKCRFDKSSRQKR